MALTQVKAEGIATGAVTTTKLEDDAVSNAKLTSSTNQLNRAVGADTVQDDAIGVAALSATGTASNTTFLRGDNSWVTPTDTNTTYSVGDGGLTQNNFTDADHTKLDGIAAGAEVNVQSDWNSSSGDNQILNKPTVPTVTGSTNNTITTVTGANAIQGEANLTFDGSTLKLLNASVPQIRINNDTSDGSSTRLLVGKATASNNFFNGAADGDSCISAPSNLLLGVGTSEKIRIDSNGKVGIGETSPASILQVKDAGSLSDPTIKAHISGSNGGNLGFGLYSDINSKYTFKVTNNGRVHVNDGIDFSMTSNAGGMTNEVLNDYEEGTFTATPENSVSLHGSADTVSYTKIGRIVHVSGSVQINGDNSNAHFTISNLPFTTANNTERSNLACGSVELYNWDLGSNQTYGVSCHTWGNTSTLEFACNADNTSRTNLNADADAYITFTITYTAA